MLPARIRSRTDRGKVSRRCPAHCTWVREHACCVSGCDGRPIHAHHIRTADNSGTGLKPSDRWVVSLCGVHHHLVHQGQDSFERIHAVDLSALAAEFARKSPHRRKLEAMP